MEMDLKDRPIIDDEVLPLVAGAYARVSTGRQEKEETIEYQMDAIRAQIKADGNLLPDENIFLDDGWTGELLPRPGLDAMRMAAREEKFQVLYVYDRGRVSRIYAYQEIVIEELENRGLLFRSLKDAPVTNEQDKVLQAMQGVFHQHERVKIAERFRQAKLFRAKQGALINGKLPYGYTKVNRNGKEPSRAEINQEEAQVIRKIREWFGNDGMSAREIVMKLHDQNIAPPLRKHSVWSVTSIYRILRSTTYHSGIVYYNKRESVISKHPRSQTQYRRVKRNSHRFRPKDQWLPIQVPPLFPDDGLYERIQARLKVCATHGARNRKYAYLLAGKVQCSCGSRRIGHGYLNHHYYRCVTSTYPVVIGERCPVRGVNAQALDEQVSWELSHYLSDSKRLRSHASRWLEHRPELDLKTITEQTQLTELLSRSKTEEQRYVRAYGAGALEFDHFRNSMHELKQRTARYETALEELSSKSRRSSRVPNFKALCHQAKMKLRSLDVKSKGRVLSALIEKVTVGLNNQIEVLARIPIIDNMMAFDAAYHQVPCQMPTLELRFSFEFTRPKPGRPGRNQIQSAR